MDATTMVMTNDDDLISNANTDSSLLSSSDDNITKDCCHHLKLNDKQKKTLCVPYVYVILAIVSIIWGVCTIIWTPFDLLMNERLRMMPGLPPYDWWKSPPDQVLFKAYIFNVTNSQEFLNDRNIKLSVVEVGPIVYMEKLIHSNVTFNPNGTMTYVATRKAIFLPELNHLDLNSTVTVPNFAVLGMASFLSEESFFIKFGFNLLVRSVKPTPFVTLTLNQLLWNFTDPMLTAGRKMAPGMVPTNNLGFLSRVYSKFENTVTVYIGSKFGNQKFFLIDKYDGSEYLPEWGHSCPSEKLTESTEGVAYPQFITTQTKIHYWRKTLCKNALLLHRSNQTMYGVHAFRFEFPNNSYDRTVPRESDCFKSSPTLPDGLSDISKCHFGFPLAVSFPHYLHGDPILSSYVDGLNPNETKHSSFVVIEPVTGIPLESRARSQCNLVVKSLKGFNDLVGRFSDTVLPMFWLEYMQVGLPWYISSLIYFQVNILTILQRFFTAFLLAAGVISFAVYWNHKRRKQTAAMLVKNKALVFETEIFINRNKV